MVNVLSGGAWSTASAEAFRNARIKFSEWTKRRMPSAITRGRISSVKPGRAHSPSRIAANSGSSKTTRFSPVRCKSPIRPIYASGTITLESYQSPVSKALIWRHGGQHALTYCAFFGTWARCSIRTSRPFAYYKGTLSHLYCRADLRGHGQAQPRPGQCLGESGRTYPLG